MPEKNYDLLRLLDEMPVYKERIAEEAELKPSHFSKLCHGSRSWTTEYQKRVKAVLEKYSDDPRRVSKIMRAIPCRDSI